MTPQDIVAPLAPGVREVDKEALSRTAGHTVFSLVHSSWHSLCTKSLGDTVSSFVPTHMREH